MCNHIILGAQVAREMIEAGEYEDVVSKGSAETRRRGEDSKFFPLGQKEKEAGRDPRRAFEDRGWERGTPGCRRRERSLSVMPAQPRKMSEIMKEMSETLLRNPGSVPSSEAAHVALFFANVAWNESIGLDYAREGYRNVWETIEAENPALWNEFKTSDIGAMIDELVRYKQTHYPDDRRRILTCGMLDDKVRVEWLNAAAPGVDSKWEMQLYGLVRTGEKEKAIRFLEETRHLSRSEAAKRVKQIAAELGIR